VLALQHSLCHSLIYFGTADAKLPVPPSIIQVRMGRNKRAKKMVGPLKSRWRLKAASPPARADFYMALKRWKLPCNCELSPCARAAEPAMLLSVSSSGSTFHLNQAAQAMMDCTWQKLKRSNISALGQTIVRVLSAEPTLKWEHLCSIRREE
jgi:hypothetical protein